MVEEEVDPQKDEERTSDEEDDEAKQPKYMRDPGQPSQKQIEEHDILHLEYRSWCKWCVLGKGQSDHHLRQKGEKDELGQPTMSIDYMFVGTKNVKAKDRTVLTVFDNRTKAVLALMVHSKGPVEWAVQAVVKFIEQLGYGQIAVSVQCDNEPSISAVMNAIAME